jgi:polygalacturonase
MKYQVLSALVFALTAAHSILDFGAIENDASVASEMTNAKAITDAIMAAHNKENGDKTVIIPEGKTFSSLPVHASHIRDIEIVIDGTLLVSKHYEHYKTDPERWASMTDGYYTEEFLTFRDVEDIIFRGKGEIDGQGYMWWIREILRKNPIGRPKVLRIVGGKNIEFSGITVRNGPYYHIHVYDVEDVHFHDFEIHVDVMGQLEIGEIFAGKMLGEMIDDGLSIRAPMFPLNTDGIDPHGKNILIERINITNYDDAVAVKPVYNNATRVDCSENIMIRDVIVHFSVGLSIGSVPPANEYACIRNVTIKDSVLYYPIKAIYVKTNSG